MTAPLLRAEIDIDAPVSTVWNLIADISRMPQWSPQCRMMKALGPLRPGTRTVNLNRRHLLFWPTTSTITAVRHQRELSFRVNTNNTVWSYQLEPQQSGTQVTLSRHAENGTRALSILTIKAVLGGTAQFERELLAGMNLSLKRIKAAAETAETP